MVAIRDGLFVLISLLLGFTLAMSAPRYTARRSLLIEEASAIGTTYRRAATLPQPYRDKAWQLLRQYVDARLDLGNAGLDHDQEIEASIPAKRIQKKLWQDAAESAKDDAAITGPYINSLNEIINLQQKRTAAQEDRIPLPI
jgi:hypothetical protein